MVKKRDIYYVRVNINAREYYFDIYDSNKEYITSLLNYKAVIHYSKYKEIIE